MIEHKRKPSCQSCIYREKDPVWGLICKHKASMEGIEALKEFYTFEEVQYGRDCALYEYDEYSPMDR